MPQIMLRKDLMGPILTIKANKIIGFYTMGMFIYDGRKIFISLNYLHLVLLL